MLDAIRNHHLTHKTKVVLLVFGLVVIVGTLVGWVFYNGYLPWKPAAFTTEMGGKIIAVDGDKITVQGYLIGIPPEQKTLVSVVFTVSDTTTLTKRVLKVGGHPSGELYTPESQESAGTRSDLKLNVQVDRIQSKKNLAGASSAVAVEAHYTIMDLRITPPPK